MKEEQPTELPFLGGLTETNFSENKYIQSFDIAPHKLVRFGQEYEADDTRTFQEVLDEFRTGKQLFEELEQNYGILVPHIDLVVGSRPDHNRAMYLVTDRVYGFKLEYVVEDTFDAPLQRETQKLCEAIGKYFIDKGRQGGHFLSDFWIGQFVYGKRVGENENHIYMVDVDPHIGFYDAENRLASSNNLYYKALEEFANMLNEIQELSSGVDFSKVRKTTLEFVNHLPELRPYIGRVQAIKELLQQ